MKKKRYFFILLIFLNVFLSCKKDDMVYENDFNKSYQSWVNFKKSSGNSYRYRITGGSWTGLGTETTITIREGKVIQRTFVLRMPDKETHLPVVLEEWTEEKTGLNSHAYAAATLTLDEIYQKASTEWLLNRENVKTYFETANQGMISSCGYTENNCADDCFVGINISMIEKL